jgi:hypothetical protein
MRYHIIVALVALLAGLGTASGDPASVQNGFSNRSARFVRPQFFLAVTLADQSTGSAHMSADLPKSPQFSDSGFDVVKAKQASTASPTSTTLSSAGAKMARPQNALATTLADESAGSARLTRPQYVAATTLSDESGSARFTRPQYVAATTLSDESGSARFTRPQYVAATTLTDDAAGSARMAAEPSRNPQGPMSGFDILKADAAGRKPGGSDLSAANSGSRAAIERRDTSSK